MARQGIASSSQRYLFQTSKERSPGMSDVGFYPQNYVPMRCMSMHCHSCRDFRSLCRSGRQLPWHMWLRGYRHNMSAWRHLRLLGNFRRYRWVAIRGLAKKKGPARARTLLLVSRMASGPAAIQSTNEASVRKRGRVCIMASGRCSLNTVWSNKIYPLLEKRAYREIDCQQRAAVLLYNGGKRLMRLDCHSAKSAIKREMRLNITCADIGFFFFEQKWWSVWLYSKRRIAKLQPGRSTISFTNLAEPFPCRVALSKSFFALPR